MPPALRRRVRSRLRWTALLKPRTDDRLLGGAVALVAFPMMWIGLTTVGQPTARLFAHPELEAIRTLLSVGCVLGSVGLWLCRGWARCLAVVFLWIVAIAPFGIINPHFAIDAHVELPDGEMRVFIARALAFTVVALVLLHILGKKKASFQ